VAVVLTSVRTGKGHGGLKQVQIDWRRREREKEREGEGMLVDRKVLICGRTMGSIEAVSRVKVSQGEVGRRKGIECKSSTKKERDVHHSLVEQSRG
jgi:hypothetical protein